MKKYYGIDWLRAIACIGIVAMHMADNNSYQIGGFLYNKIIPSLTDFVFLFMTVSAFGMCCGYYKMVTSGEINFTLFYKKRYAKILPFFLVLIALDLIVSFSFRALCEGFAEATLLHGFIPSTLSVIGVGWFLGVVFIFYLIFPFFCVLIETKRRAWLSFIISVALNLVCDKVFDLNRTNFLYSLCFFVAGGLIYLYKEALEKIKWYFGLPILCLAIAVYYIVPTNVLTLLFVTAAGLIFAISLKLKEVKPVSFVSGLSLEIYLSHMFVFRALEKVNLNTRFGNGLLQYLITFTVVIVGTVLFAFALRTIINKLSKIKLNK